MQFMKICSYEGFKIFAFHTKYQSIWNSVFLWCKMGIDFSTKVNCHPASLTYLQTTSCKILGWIHLKLESRFQGEISTISEMQMTPLNSRKQRGTKEPLDEGERGEWILGGHYWVLYMSCYDHQYNAEQTSLWLIFGMNGFNISPLSGIFCCHCCSYSLSI